MKKFFTLAFAFIFLASAGAAMAQHRDKGPKRGHKKELVIKMNALTQHGPKPAGEIIAQETPYGVAFYPNLTNVPSGIHGFHVHAKPDCGPTEKGLGMRAGGHWDPKKTDAHSFPWDNNGHKGDLPALYSDKDMNVQTPVLSVKIKSLEELRGHALMVHVGGDNYHDNPAPLGGGGPRMICGEIR